MHLRSFVNEGRLSEIEKQAAFKLRIVNKAEYAGYAVWYARETAGVHRVAMDNRAQSRSGTTSKRWTSVSIVLAGCLMGAVTAKAMILA